MPEGRNKLAQLLIDNADPEGDYIMLADHMIVKHSKFLHDIISDEFVKRYETRVRMLHELSTYGYTTHYRGTYTIIDLTKLTKLAKQFDLS